MTLAELLKHNYYKVGIRDLDPVYNYSLKAKPGDNAFRIFAPDNYLLNRGEAYEVVDFLNAFSEMMGFTTLAQCQKAERLLHELDSSVRGREQLKIMLREKWRLHSGLFGY